MYEVGLIGREGMSGIAVVLGGDQSPHSTYIQVAGEGQRITAKELRKAMNASQTLHSLLLKFVQVFMVQTAHTAIANARAHIDQRLARWILMAHDRTGDNTLPLTHEFLSLMLGVRRAGVTEALQSLKRQKLIDNGRNKIVVRNRKGIERLRGDPTARPKRNIGGSLDRPKRRLAAPRLPAFCTLPCRCGKIFPLLLGDYLRARSTSPEISTPDPAPK